MAQLIINIPDTVATRVYAALGSHVGGPVGAETAGQTAKRDVVNYIKSTTMAYEANLGAASASATASTDVQIS